MERSLVDLSDAGTAILGDRRPGLAEATSSHYSELAAIAGPELVELCRARVQALVAQTSEATASGAAQTEAGRACLNLTDQLCLSAQWVSEDQIQAVREHLEAGQVFALVVAISLVERWYRLVAFTAEAGVGR